MSALARTYGGVMTLAAGAARVASGVPGAPARWRGFADRLGRLTPGQAAALEDRPAFWAHAASVGELSAVRPLLAQLRARFPGRAWIVSTLTRTGLALAAGLPETDVALLFPLDAPAIVERVLRRVRLDAFFFSETEIWPVWLGRLAASGVPAFMVSGRVGEGTRARARLLRRLYRDALSEVVCCMQTDRDAQAIVALGADPVHVYVAGSLKFDALEAAPPAEVVRLRALLERGGRRAIVAGSTHAGEEEMVLAAYDRIVRGHGDLVLVLAPRHPERVDGVAELVRRGGFALRRFRELVDDAGATLPPGPTVVLLDVVGPLPHCYALGAVAFVGGSLVPVGGHNVLEPARAGRPVIVGPHTTTARDVVDRLIAARAALRVESIDALAWTLDHLLATPDEATAMGWRGHALAQTGQGAVDRHMKIIAARLTREWFVRESEP